MSALGSLIRALTLLEKGLILMIPFNLHCLLRGPIVTYSHTGNWGSNLNYEFGGTLFSLKPTFTEIN